MPTDRITALRDKLLKLIPADPNEISRVPDHIQKLAKFSPELTRGCEFSQAQRMRRLVTLKAQAWGITEERWASQALDWIGALSQQRGPQAALMLACYGVRHRDLGDALDQLEAARDAVEPVKPPVEEPEPQTADAAPAKQPRKKKTQAAQPTPDDGDDTALDAQTQAELDALLKEAEGLKGK